jgi:hypothetical protein
MEVLGWAALYHQQGPFQVSKLEPAVDVDLIDTSYHRLRQETTCLDLTKLLESRLGVNSTLLRDRQAGQICLNDPHRRSRSGDVTRLQSRLELCLSRLEGVALEESVGEYDPRFYLDELGFRVTLIGGVQRHGRESKRVAEPTLSAGQHRQSARVTSFRLADAVVAILQDGLGLLQISEPDPRSSREEGQLLMGEGVNTS